MLESTSRSRRYAGRAVAGLSVAGLLTAGTVFQNAHAAPSHATTTITMWANYSGPDQTGVKAIVNGFNSSQSSVHVAYDEQSFTSYATKLSTALSAGKGPDIWNSDNTGMTTYADQNQLADLGPYLSKFKDLSPKNFSKPVWNGGKYNGHVYAIPLDVLPLTMYYNKALFRKAHLNPNKPPVGSLKEFLAAAKKLTHGNQWGFVMAPDWPQPFIWQSYIAQFGGKVFDVKNQKAVVNSSAGVKTLTTMRDMIYKYKVSPPNTAVDQDWKMLGNGTAAMILDGPWEYTNQTIQSLGSNLGYSIIPQWGKKQAVFLGTHYLMVYGKNSTSARVNAALKFADYWQKHSIEMAKVGDTPAYNPVIKSAAFKKLNFQKVISKSLKYAVLSPNFPRYHDNYLYADITNVLRGKSSDIKGALDDAASKMTAAAQGS